MGKYFHLVDSELIAGEFLTEQIHDVMRLVCFSLNISGNLIDGFSQCFHFSVNVATGNIIGHGVIGESVNHSFGDADGFSDGGECVACHVGVEVETDRIIDLLNLYFRVTMV